MVRAGALALLSIVVCSALLVGVVSLTVYATFIGEPWSTTDWVASGITFTLSVVTLVVSGTASLRATRARQTTPFGLLARAVPVLVLLGLALGTAATVSLLRSMEEGKAFFSERACEVPEFWKLEASTCPAVATDCQRRAWRTTPPTEGDLAPLRAAIDEVVNAMTERQRLYAADDGGKDRFARFLADELNAHTHSARYRHGMYLCLLQHQR